jgi:hypothetical protein
MSAEAGLDMLQNDPLYFEVLENNTAATLSLRGTEPTENKTLTLFTSRFTSRQFRVAPVYGLLFTIDTKANTDLIQTAQIYTEQPDENFKFQSLVAEIAIFIIMVIGLLCIGFEHADIKFKRWLLPNKSLLMLIFLQIIGSKVFPSLFTLFELDSAKGLSLGTDILSILTDILHIFYWLDCFLFESNIGAVSDVLVKGLATCLCITHVFQRGTAIATDLHFVDAMDGLLFYSQIVYSVLTGIYLIIGVAFWLSVMRRPRQNKMEEKEEKPQQKNEDGENVEEFEVQLPNNDLLSRFLATMALLASSVFLLAPLAGLVYPRTPALLIIIAWRIVPAVTDLCSFFLACPNGIDYTTEEEEDYTRDDTYDDQPTGFIQNLREQQARRENIENHPDQPVRRRQNEGQRKFAEPSAERELDDVDVDVDVDNVEEVDEYSDEGDYQPEANQDEDI